MMRTGYLLRTAIPARLLGGLLAAVALSACQSTTDIVADDSFVPLPSLRVGLSIDEGKQPPAEAQTGRALEISLTRASGSAKQTLPNGAPPLVFNDLTFYAPQQFKHDFDINYADLSFRWRKFFGERALGLELSGGIGHTSLGLTVATATQHTAARFNNYGGQGGIGFIWRMRPGTSLHAHLSGFLSRKETGVRDMGRYELFLAQGLGDNLALRAGYAKWEVNGASGWDTSDFRMTFAGPTLELGLTY